MAFSPTDLLLLGLEEGRYAVLSDHSPHPSLAAFSFDFSCDSIFPFPLNPNLNQGLMSLILTENLPVEMPWNTSHLSLSPFSAI
jgi:hypothetical protein